MVRRTITLVGNFTLDRVGRENRPGGSVYYSGATAAALGLQVRIVSALGPGFPLAEVEARFPFELAAIEALETTVMENLYLPDGRRQILHAAGGKIGRAEVPPRWTGDGTVLLCPVFGELTPELSRRVRGRLTGASLQGWLREGEPGGPVRAHTDGSFLEQLAGVDLLFYSDEDLRGDSGLAAAIEGMAAITVETRGPAGAVVSSGGSRRKIAGFPVAEVDPTGAGDTFAAAFLAAFSHEPEPEAAARFACRVAALAVARQGTLRPEDITNQPALRELCHGWSRGS